MRERKTLDQHEDGDRTRNMCWGTMKMIPTRRRGRLHDLLIGSQTWIHEAELLFLFWGIVGVRCARRKVRVMIIVDGLRVVVLVVHGKVV